MADLVPLTISRTGVLDTLAAAAVGGDALTLNTGKQYLHVNNGGGAPITVTIAFNSSAIIDGQTATNKTVSITNGTSKLIGPFPPSLYNDALSKVQITYSAVTTVTVGAFTLSPELS